MSTRRTFWNALAALPFLAGWLAAGIRAKAQVAPPASVPNSGLMTITIFLRHDQSKTVDQINEHLKAAGWFRDFPPPGVEVLSWYVMMGIGQVVTLRFPPDRLRDVNRLVEGEAWGGYRTEFYPTYDFRPIYAQLQQRMR